MPLLMTSQLPQEPKPFLDTKNHHNQPPKRQGKHEKRRHHHDQDKKKKKPSSSSSWVQLKNLLITCKQMEAGSGRRVHDPSKIRPANPVPRARVVGSSSCSSICSFRDVVHGNTRVVHRADTNNNSPDLTIVQVPNKAVSSGSGRGGSISSSASRAMHFRKLSGCYECRMVVDPTTRRYPHIPRATICACSKCGEVFPNMESLELHQAVRHAVSELGPEDSGRNIVEIIFKSSWLKKDSPICKIQRILKVHNTPKTIQRFEDCRDAVKTRALASTRKNPRCAADGNELLRFHCTTLDCSLGDGGSTSLCGSIPCCGVCAVIRHGLQGKSGVGVRTTASSGRAHDSLQCSDGRRAMLVCRVIAGRVKRMAPETVEGTATVEEGAVTGGAYDSVAGYGGSGAYSNLEELFVLNARAILPCFVVIYKALES